MTAIEIFRAELRATMKTLHTWNATTGVDDDERVHSERASRVHVSPGSGDALVR